MDTENTAIVEAASDKLEAVFDEFQSVPEEALDTILYADNSVRVVGPCSKRHGFGKPFRRHLPFSDLPEGHTRHVTKNRVSPPTKEKGREMFVIPTYTRPGPNLARMVRNIPKDSVPGGLRRRALREAA